ncbi:MAG: metal-sulfur cluster assembly factor [Calditrichia bacterium]
MDKEKQIWQKLETVMDPEFPMNVVEMGLIYDVAVEENTGSVHIVMTLTTPGCPLHSRIKDDINNALKGIEWVREVEVELVFDPRWTIDMMTEEAKRKIGR